jgi:hypothetical protein
MRAERSAARETEAALTGRLAAAAKDRSRLLKELSVFLGRDLHAATPPDPGGLRWHLRTVPAIGEDVRLLAAAYASQPGAVFAAAAPEAILIACSADSGVSAAELLRRVAEKGGGTAVMAQGPVADGAAALKVLQDAMGAERHGTAGR